MMISLVCGVFLALVPGPSDLGIFLDPFTESEPPLHVKLRESQAVFGGVVDVDSKVAYVAVEETTTGQNMLLVVSAGKSREVALPLASRYVLPYTKDGQVRLAVCLSAKDKARSDFWSQGVPDVHDGDVQEYALKDSGELVPTKRSFARLTDLSRSLDGSKDGLLNEVMKERPYYDHWLSDADSKSFVASLSVAGSWSRVFEADDHTGFWICEWKGDFVPIEKINGSYVRSRDPEQVVEWPKELGGGVWGLTGSADHSRAFFTCVLPRPGRSNVERFVAVRAIRTGAGRWGATVLEERSAVFPRLRKF